MLSREAHAYDTVDALIRHLICEDGHCKMRDRDEDLCFHEVIKNLPSCNRKKRLPRLVRACKSGVDRISYAEVGRRSE